MSFSSQAKSVSSPSKIDLKGPMSIHLTFAAIAALAGLGIRPKAPRKTTGSSNESQPEWMDQLPAIPQDRKITRAGFPWPTETPIYHATTAIPSILRQGFRTRKEGTQSALGGRHMRSISTTLSHRHAASIALGLDTLRRVAQDEISLVDLMKRLTDETGFTDIYLYGIDGVSRAKDDEEALSILSIYDQGYMGFSIPKKEEEIKIPPGAIEVYETEYWVYGFVKDADKYENIKYINRKNDVGFSLYKTSLYFGKNKEKCFDPLFVGTNMNMIKKLSKKDIGVIRAKTSISRVATDERGAIRLGYIHERTGGDLLSQLYRNAEDSIDENSLESKERAMNRPLLASWLGGYGYQSDYIRPFPNRYGQMDGDVPKEKDQWILRQQGKRTPSETMLYYDSEMELRIFDTSKISIESKDSISDIKKMYKLKNRITFPYFDKNKEDVRVWPVGIKRNSW